MVGNFWVDHRHYVIDRHYGKLIRRAESIAEIGDGLLMAHCDRKYRKKIDRFDVHGLALDQDYDLLFLLTVLEKVEDEVEVLNAVAACLKPGGRLIVDLPMQSWLYSSVDRRLGRLRRYDTRGAIALFKSVGFEVVEAVPWGHVYNGVLWWWWVRRWDGVNSLGNWGDRIMGGVKCLDHFIPPLGMGSGAFFVLRKLDNWLERDFSGGDRIYR
jgi:SAM-dependent methyltransferase